MQHLDKAQIIEVLIHKPTCIVFHPTQDKAYIGNSLGKIKVLDLKSEKVTYEITMGSKRIETLYVCHEHLISFGDDKICYWTLDFPYSCLHQVDLLSSERRKHVEMIDRYSINKLPRSDKWKKGKFSSDGSTLFAEARDDFGIIKLCTQTGKVIEKYQIASLEGYESYDTALHDFAVSHDHQKLVASWLWEFPEGPLRQPLITLWDLQTKQLLDHSDYGFRANGDTCYDGTHTVSFSQSEGKIAATYDGRLNLFSGENFAVSVPEFRYNHEIESMSFFPDGKKMLIGDEKGKIYSISPVGEKLVEQAEAQLFEDAVCGLVFSQDGLTLAAWDNLRTVKFFKTETMVEHL